MNWRRILTISAVIVAGMLVYTLYLYLGPYRKISRRFAPPLAYIAGSLGTLVGADLLNLGEIQRLGAPIASIGGAGTFDAIFLTGILAVLLAGLFTPRSRRR